ncbi:hypothetical protein FSP39_021944 [Pinctada imbricata]|uniref:Transmembrane protein 184C n=1 Tax=Pinctada imbricata TaxID=66713 RepID=A0AA88Y8W9_PINIB|nr:hypothetical protein FSP39_021944 [Pinctada imbricata]
MDFFLQWRKWIRPFAMTLYIVLALIALPLCIVELDRKGAPTHVEAWFAGGIFVMCAVPISLWGILQHLVNYTQPTLQRHIIRILWMVPIYAANAWFALRFTHAAIYLDTLRECYEAYVIYNFMAYLLNFLWIEHPQLEHVLMNKEQVKHICPMCCLPSWRMRQSFIDRCKHGALQYTIVRPLTTITALICQLCGKYQEGELDPKSAWLYLTIINNISQVWAMYCLVLFYKAMKEELAPIKPVPKFLCVKFVVFFSFWQSVVIAIMVELNWIPNDGKWIYYDDIKGVAAAIQDFLICIEMFIAAIAHYYSFSHKPFINPESQNTDWWTSFRSMWDVSDMRDDVIEHVTIIGNKVKKTVSKPLIKTQNEAESIPLISSSENYGTGSNFLASQNSMDWDNASLEVSSTYQTKPSSNSTASMNNYVDLDSNPGDVFEREVTHKSKTLSEAKSEDGDEPIAKSKSSKKRKSKKSKSDAGVKDIKETGENEKLSQDDKKKDDNKDDNVDDTNNSSIPDSSLMDVNLYESGTFSNYAEK